MATVRSQTRQISQTLSVKFNSKIPVAQQCRALLLSQIRDTPSEWGIMIDDDLTSISVSDTSGILYYGNKNHITPQVVATYNTVHLKIGDVLFGIGMAEPVDSSAPVSTYRKVNIVKMPFVLTVNTLLQAKQMNLIVVDTKSEYLLTYILKPAFYPHYSPIVASMCVHREMDEFYPGGTLPASPRTLIENRLLDPLIKVMPIVELDRMKRIVADIKRMLSIGPVSIKVGGVDLVWGRKSKLDPSSIDGSKDIVIEFITDVIEKDKSMKKRKYYDYVRPPSMPLIEDGSHHFIAVYACVTWPSEPERHTDPTSEDVVSFKNAVANYLHMKEMEALSLREIFSKDTLQASSKAPAVENVLVKAWLDEGALLIKNTDPLPILSTPTTSATSATSTATATATAQKKTPKRIVSKKTRTTTTNSSAVATTAVTTTIITADTTSTASAASTSSASIVASTQLEHK